MKAVIVDLDGTISDVKKRLHYVETKPKNFRRFMLELVNDDTIEHTLIAIRAFRDAGYKIVFCTAREEDYRTITESWLKEKLIDFHDKIYMRTSKDNRKDYIVKRELLDKIREDGYIPEIVFEDSQACCKMWRDEGLYVFDVCQGKDYNIVP